MRLKTVRIAVVAILASTIVTAGCSKPADTSKAEVDAPVVELAKPDEVDMFFADGGTIVTESTYPILETSRQFLINQSRAGINTFMHNPTLTPTDNQPAVRMNRDTYYSLAVVDVSKGAVVSIPAVGEGKYVSLQGVTEDHRIQAMHYGPGTIDLATHTGTHLYIIVRLDGTINEVEAKKIQAQMKIEAGSNNRFTAEPVDEASFHSVENALKSKSLTLNDRDGVMAMAGMFTAPGDESNEMFTQEKYEIGAAIGWGGAQWIDNIYELSGNYPDDVCHQATFTDPENDAFWSITVYDKAGFMFNDLANVSSNTILANSDGTYTVSFGCGEEARNNLETSNPSGVFNLAIRHYRPSDLVREEGFRILPTVAAVGI